MTNRIEVAQAPAPLEAYAKHFDPVFSKSNQREGFRHYLEGLLLPSERNKTLTALVNTEPLVGAQQLQWFLSESTWEERQVQAQRLKLLRENPRPLPMRRECWSSMRRGIARTVTKRLMSHVSTWGM